MTDTLRERLEQALIDAGYGADTIGQHVTNHFWPLIESALREEREKAQAYAVKLVRLWLRKQTSPIDVQLIVAKLDALEGTDGR